jgi:hypothetical protein
MDKRQRVSRRRSPSYWRYRPLRKFDVRKLLRDFETFTKAENRNLKTVESLKKLKRLKRLTRSGYRKLAKPIRRCRKGQRCGKILCSECRRRYRMREVGETLRLLENTPPEQGQGPWMVTLVPADQRKAPNQLHTFQPRTLIERVKRQLKRGGLTLVAIGGVEISYEVDAEANPSKAWQPHLHLIVWGCSRKQLKEALKPHYPATNEVKRPVLVQEVGDAAGASSYCFKPFFGRHTRKGGRRGPVQALKPSAFLELAKFLDQTTMNALRILIGVRQRRDGRFARPSSGNDGNRLSKGRKAHSGLTRVSRVHA